MKMIDYFSGVKPEHLKFAQKVWTNQENYLQSRLGRLVNGKPAPKPKQLPNDKHICVTRTGIYTDSGPRGYPPGVDKICRMRANIICDVLLPALKINNPKQDVPYHFGSTGAEGVVKGKIRIHNISVKLNTFAVQSILSVAMMRKMRVPVCQCCGLPSKYVYVECTLVVSDHPDPKKRSVKRSYNLAFYGVNDVNEELRMTVDHIVPQSEGGKNVLSNMQIMCSKCNSLKASIPSDVFFKHRGVLEHLIAQDAKQAQAA